MSRHVMHPTVALIITGIEQLPKAHKTHTSLDPFFPDTASVLGVLSLEGLGAPPCFSGVSAANAPTMVATVCIPF